MKSDRVTLLTTPEFKTFLSKEAAREGLSVAELVRRRCERRPSEEERHLAALSAELRRAVAGAQAALRDGLSEAHAVLSELNAARAPAAVASRRRRTAGVRA